MAKRKTKKPNMSTQDAIKVLANESKKMKA